VHDRRSVCGTPCVTFICAFLFWPWAREWTSQKSSRFLAAEVCASVGVVQSRARLVQVCTASVTATNSAGSGVHHNNYSHGNPLLPFG
jgi:hypothetical protein